MQAGKHPEIIATKVLLPRSVGLIERPRLVELFTQVQTKRLSVIKAPAGFGKTSLAIAWADRLVQTGNSVAWFSIDPNDNELTQFLFYVAHALQRAHDGLGPSRNRSHSGDLLDQPTGDHIDTDQWHGGD